MPDKVAIKMEQLIGSEQTVKTQKIYENDIKKLERAFSVSYRTWAQTCYKVKPALRTFCSKIVLWLFHGGADSPNDVFLTRSLRLVSSRFHSSRQQQVVVCVANNKITNPSPCIYRCALSYFLMLCVYS